MIKMTFFFLARAFSLQGVTVEIFDTKRLQTKVVLIQDNRRPEMYTIFFKFINAFEKNMNMFSKQGLFTVGIIFLRGKNFSFKRNMLISVVLKELF